MLGYFKLRTLVTNNSYLNCKNNYALRSKSIYCIKFIQFYSFPFNKNFNRFHKFSEPYQLIILGMNSGRSY
jgi:hypothetical protein